MPASATEYSVNGADARARSNRLKRLDQFITERRDFLASIADALFAKDQWDLAVRIASSESPG
jgi:hypothetical protein